MRDGERVELTFDSAGEICTQASSLRPEERASMNVAAGK